MTPTLTALLKPTGEYLGKEIQGGVESLVEGWKKKRREKNLAKHIEEVRKDLKDERSSDNQEKEPTLAQINFFEEWVEGVQDVEPHNEDLSKIWQSLLAAAANGENHPVELISILKTLTPPEAEYLMNFEARPAFRLFGGKAKYAYIEKSLEKKNVIEKDYRMLLVTAFVMVVVGISLLFFNTANLGMGFTFETISIVSPALMVGAVLLFPVFVSTVRWQLTWIGEKLVSTAKRGR